MTVYNLYQAFNQVIWIVILDISGPRSFDFLHVPHQVTSKDDALRPKWHEMPSVVQSLLKVTVVSALQ